MNEDQYRTWEILIKLLSVVGVLIGAAWALCTYYDTKEKEYYSFFWQEKYALFLKASTAASIMATTDNVDEFNKAKGKYWSLFYGPLSLVEGVKVKQAMIEYSTFIPKEIDEKKLPYSKLKDPTYRLTLQLKNELGKAWENPFGELILKKDFECAKEYKEGKLTNRTAKPVDDGVMESE